MPVGHPGPFWRKQTNCYCVQIGPKQIRLAKDKAEAYRLYHELMARKPEEPQVVSPPSATITAAGLIDEFVEWTRINRERLTFEAYKRRLAPLVDSIPRTLPASDLKPYHLTRVMDAREWNPTTKNDFATAAIRAYNWAVRQGLVERNPLAGMEKAAREVRELALRPGEYEEVMAHVKEPHFRTLLGLAWETGAMPQELRVIEARHCEPARIVLLPKESKGRKQRRIIYLGTDRAREIVKGLCERHPSGPILRNSNADPWKKDAINSAFCRLEEKIGRKLYLSAWRKSYCTEALKNGVDTITVAGLMGHANAVMISKVYAKVQQDQDFMEASARKASVLSRKFGT